MHALGRFVQERMDRDGWRRADLARASGLSPQVVSKLLDPERDSLARPLAPETVAGLARALGGAHIEQQLWLKVAESMGLPVGDAVLVADPGRLSDLELLRELLRRAEARENRGGGSTKSVTLRAADQRNKPSNRSRRDKR